MRLLLTFLIFVSILKYSVAQQELDPAFTEVWEPVPPTVQTGLLNAPPSDALVLFDGKDLSKWKGKTGNAVWLVHDNCMTVVKGTGEISTIDSFDNFQLHLEWKTPSKIEGEGQGRGNSGVFLLGKYEIQILDNFNNKTYSNGQAGSVYKQHIPLVNACKPAGEWQTYDIVFSAPKFKSDGVLEKPAYVTVFQNQVLVQNHVEIKGRTVYRGQPTYSRHGKGPIVLQDHGNPVSFRNIWIRRL